MYVLAHTRLDEFAEARSSVQAERRSLYISFLQFKVTTELPRRVSHTRSLVPRVIYRHFSETRL